MIAVTGATGTIGSALLRLLSRRGEEVRALSRHPERSDDLPGVTRTATDLADRDRLRDALAGAERLFLLTGNSADMVRLQKNAVRAAEAAGVRHVVKLSALGASDHSRSVIGLWHHVVEHALHHADLAWTLLRPHHFMQNLLDPGVCDVEAGVVYSATGDGEIPFVDTRDIAAVAAEVLTADGHARETYTLTGPEAISYPRAAEILGEVTGRGFRHVDETPEQHFLRRRRNGDPVWLIAAQLAIAGYQRAGGPTAETSEEVERVTGERPRSFERFVEDHADRFAG